MNSASRFLLIRCVKVAESIGIDGRSPTNGIAGVGKKKIQRVICCIREALRREDIEFLINAACISFFRDERNARLAIRIYVITPAMQTRHIFLGQARHFGTGAISITNATREVMVRSCTKNADIAYGSELKVPCRQQFNQRAFQKFRNSIRMCAVDAATDEVNSVRDMRCPVDGSEPLAPHNEMILRDKAHAARRAIHRPWKADPVLSHLMVIFIQGKHSIMQTIQNSEHIRAIFTNHCRNIKHGFAWHSRLLVSVHAAKHRHESWTTPIGIFVLYWIALVNTAMDIRVLRKGVEVLININMRCLCA